VSGPAALENKGWLYHPDYADDWQRRPTLLWGDPVTVDTFPFGDKEDTM